LKDCSMGKGATEGIQVPGKLFVSRFPPECHENELKSEFEPFGKILELVILKKDDKKKSAFVRYADVNYCDAAIRNLHGQKWMSGADGALKVQFAAGEIERLQINVDYSYLPDPDQDPQASASVNSFGTGEAKLFVGALPKDSNTEGNVQSLFQRFGDITEIYIIKDKQGNSTGSAFVKFSEPQAALAAIENLHGSSPLHDQTRPLEVRKAGADGKFSKKAMASPPAVYGWPSPQPQRFGRQPPTPMSQPMYGQIKGSSPLPPADNDGQGYKLFCGALPHGYSEKEVGVLFSEFGNPVDIHVMRDGQGKSKGSAFVRFARYGSARMAIDNLDRRITLPGMPRPMEVRFAGEGGPGKGADNGKGSAWYSPY